MSVRVFSESDYPFKFSPVLSPGHTAIKVLLIVVLAKQLHAHHCKDEDDDKQHKAEVAQRAHSAPNDPNQQVEGGP